MQAGIIPLIVTSNMNKYYPNTYSNIQTILPHKSNINCGFNNDCDLMIIQAIIIPTDIDLNNIFNIQIISNENIIFDIPFNNIKTNGRIIDDKYYITIPNDVFGQDNNPDFKNSFTIPFVAMKYSQFCMTINSTTDFTYEVLVQKIFCETEKRYELVNNSYYTKLINIEHLTLILIQSMCLAN